MTPCNRGCCWTPFGHSTVRDGVQGESLRCKCHEGKLALEQLLAEAARR